MRLLVKAHSRASRLKGYLTWRVNECPSLQTLQQNYRAPENPVQLPSPLAQAGALTISSHWCTATATCVPRGFVSTSTSPGTALSGLKKRTRAGSGQLNKGRKFTVGKHEEEKAAKNISASANTYLNWSQLPTGIRAFHPATGATTAGPEGPIRDLPHPPPTPLPPS